MRGHWTRAYVKARIKEWLFRAINSDTPWLTPESVRILNAWLSPEKIGIELGSGGSTLWLASRCKYLISIESDRKWFDKISTRIAKKSVRNVDYIYAGVSQGEAGFESQYLKPLSRADDNSLDFVLIDGDDRDWAALLAIRKTKPGGVVIVDNCNWFIPSDSKSPSSIPKNGRYATQNWETFDAETKGWKRRWTSSHVSDTVLFFKP